ncbi:MAG TPA: cytochrome c biogenesis heme-transporting ATPase CcmA [Pyrinomonadaceae bacterium]|nr:cytochrome c biogenesis heme-transporting ATPase CcmA [Pyrinomonadaceae bacterium]
MSRRLEANALECVRGGRTLFRNLSFSLGPGELLEVRGANGSGKTSLLRMLCGLLAPAAGQVLWRGEKISALKEEYLKELAYLGHANGVKAELNAAENLRIHYGLMVGRRADEEKVVAALERLGLGGSLWRPARMLSQGQQRRLALARLLISGRALWILDEPLAALDSAAVQLVQAVVEEHLDGGGLAVLTTHQPLQVRAGRVAHVQLEPAGER